MYEEHRFEEKFDFEDSKYWPRDCYDHGKCCNCCNCCQHHHKPQPFRIESAQFINTATQCVKDPGPTPIEFNTIAVLDGDSIILQGLNNIILQPGRYSISCHLKAKNKQGDTDTLVTKLQLDNTILDYTINSVTIDDYEYNQLNKTNLVDVITKGVLQWLVVDVPDSDYEFRLTEVSITIEKIA